MKKLLIRLIRRFVVRELRDSETEVVTLIAGKTEIPKLDEEDEKKLIRAVLDAAIKIIEKV